MLADEIALAFAVDPRQMSRTPALDVANHPGHGMFRRDRDQHVYMIRHQVPFFDPAVPLPRQPVKDLSKVLPQLPIQHFASALCNENNVILAVPRGVA